MTNIRTSFIHFCLILCSFSFALLSFLICSVWHATISRVFKILSDLSSHFHIKIQNRLKLVKARRDKYIKTTTQTRFFTLVFQMSFWHLNHGDFFVCFCIQYKGVCLYQLSFVSLSNLFQSFLKELRLADLDLLISFKISTYSK